MNKVNRSIMALCESGVMVALAVILGLIRLYRLPNGGSITIAILPLVFYAVRYGPGWGFLAGFAYGGLDYIVGHGIAIDWTSIFCDYFLAYGLLGLGAGLFHNNKYRAYIGTVVGGALMFLSCYLVGVFIWGKYMPEEFLGLTMTSPWFYSLLYNIISVCPNVVLTLILFALLHRVKPIRKQLLPDGGTFSAHKIQ